MLCPKCGTDNPDDAFFCGSCGTQLRSSFGAPPMDPPAPTADRFDSDPAPANPFGATEPNASEAYQHLVTPPDSPLPTTNVPPPPPTAYVPPAGGYSPGTGAAPTFQLPPSPPPPVQPYGPTPGQYQQQPYPGQQYPAPAPPPSYPAYGMPPGGNTSGMGQGYPVPPEASGWTFAGFIPYGLYSFFNGDTTWGVIGLVTSFLGFGLIYSIYVGITGKESAWRNRRFNSVQEFQSTMSAWNGWGLGLLIVAVVLLFLYFILIFGLAFSGALNHH